MSLTKIGSIGINTGIQFAGVTTVSTLHVGSGVTLSSDGDIFATGISTFSEDIKVGSGVTISPDGDGFYTGVVTATTFSGSLAASSLTGTVPTARLGSGTASSSTFLRGDSTFQTVNTDLVSDTSPQLGGDLDTNGNNITFGDSGSGSDDRLTFGASEDLQIYHDGSHSRIVDEGTGGLKIQSNALAIDNAAGTETMAAFTEDGNVQLRFNNSTKFETTSGGASITGNLSFGDNHYAMFGAGNDLQIYHSGTDTFFKNQTGSLNFFNSGVTEFKNAAANETLLKMTSDGSVELYHDNTKKLTTDSTGIDINTGGTEVGTKIKMYGSDALTRTRWGYSSAYKGIILGRTDVNSNSTIFMGYDPTGNTSGSFTGDGREIVFRNNTSFVTPTSANDDWNTPIRFGRGTSTEGAINFPNGVLFQNDQADANILDDYEEGTWTPTMSVGSATMSGATYTKVGRLVHVSVYANAFTDNSSSNVIQFDGLPFTSSSTQFSVNHMLLAYITTLDQSVAYIGNSLANIRLFHYDSGGDYTSLTYQAITATNNSTRRIFISMTYMTS